MTENREQHICPACHCEMTRELQGYPMGGIFVSNRFYVDIYRCPKCSRVDLFSAEGESVTCPVCGSVHNAGERCVRCALESAFDGTYTN